MSEPVQTPTRGRERRRRRRSAARRGRARGLRVRDPRDPGERPAVAETCVWPTSAASQRPPKPREVGLFGGGPGATARISTVSPRCRPPRRRARRWRSRTPAGIAPARRSPREAAGAAATAKGRRGRRRGAAGGTSEPAAVASASTPARRRPLMTRRPNVLRAPGVASRVSHRVSHQVYLY